MKRFLGATLATFLFDLGSPVQADDKDCRPSSTRRSRPSGAKEKLKKAESITLKTKGTITFGGNDSDFKSNVTLKGLDHLRSEIETEFNGEPRKFVRVLSGDKGWMKFGEEPRELKEDALANEKRRAYLEVIPMTLVALKGKAFKVETADEVKVHDKPAAGIKVTGPDKKDFTLYFDKESGLPVKLVATVAGFGNGEDFSQETTYKDYKDFDGIKKATKVESNATANPSSSRRSPSSSSWIRSIRRPSPRRSDRSGRIDCRRKAESIQSDSAFRLPKKLVTPCDRQP